MDTPEKIPLMLEAEFYPEIQTSEFRLSLRSTNKKVIIPEILNIIKLYMNV